MISSSRGGKTKARNELLKAPTSDMNKSSLGMIDAKTSTEVKNSVISFAHFGGNCQTYMS